MRPPTAPQELMKANAVDAWSPGRSAAGHEKKGPATGEGGKGGEDAVWQHTEQQCSHTASGRPLMASHKLYSPLRPSHEHTPWKDQQKPAASVSMAKARPGPTARSASGVSSSAAPPRTMGQPAWRCRSLARSASLAFKFIPQAAIRKGAAVANATSALRCWSALVGWLPAAAGLPPAQALRWWVLPTAPPPPENIAPTSRGIKKVRPYITAAIKSQQAASHSIRQSRTTAARQSGSRERGRGRQQAARSVGPAYAPCIPSAAPDHF